MSLQARLEKLRARQQQLTAALREAEATVATRRHKAMSRSRGIVGGVVLALPAGERDAVLSMLHGHMSARDREFVSDCLAGDVQPTMPAKSEPSDPT